MAVYRPKYRDPKSQKLVRSRIWWVEFTLAGKRVRESAKTTRKTLATEYEKHRRLELERAYAGLPVEARATRISTVLDFTKAYRANFDQGHRQKSKVWVDERLTHIDRLLGTKLLP